MHQSGGQSPSSAMQCHRHSSPALKLCQAKPMANLLEISCSLPRETKASSCLSVSSLAFFRHLSANRSPTFRHLHACGVQALRATTSVAHCVMCTDLRQSSCHELFRCDTSCLSNYALMGPARKSRHLVIPKQLPFLWHIAIWLLAVCFCLWLCFCLCPLSLSV